MRDCMDDTSVQLVSRTPVISIPRVEEAPNEMTEAHNVMSVAPVVQFNDNDEALLAQLNDSNADRAFDKEQ